MVPKGFPHPKSRSKIPNLMTTELFYAHIVKMNRGSLHTRSFKRIHLSVFKFQLTKNGFAGPNSFRGFRETGLPRLFERWITLSTEKNHCPAESVASAIHCPVDSVS